jgi:lipoprotein-anchoring transpeptidase ErfK/SrfK
MPLVFGLARRLCLALTVLAGMAVSTAFSPVQARESTVVYSSPYPAGTIVIDKRQRKLFLTMGDSIAMSYPIAVGMAGKAWSGWARVVGKYVSPAWSPPAIVKHDHPEMPNLIAGGAPNNPMGVRALTLDRDEIAIHGTTLSMRKSIGTAASYGCIRMYNEDVVDLFDRVSVGTPVVAIP